MRHATQNQVLRETHISGFDSLETSGIKNGSDTITYYTGEPIYFYMIGKNAGPNQVLVNENYTWLGPAFLPII